MQEGSHEAKFLLFQKTSFDVQKVSRSQFNLYFLPSIEKFEICNYITQHIEADWQIIIPIPTNWGPDFPGEVNKGHEMETRELSGWDLQSPDPSTDTYSHADLVRQISVN